jgi:hypothetical protein
MAKRGVISRAQRHRRLAKTETNALRSTMHADVVSLMCGAEYHRNANFMVRRQRTATPVSAPADQSFRERSSRIAALRLRANSRGRPSTVSVEASIASHAPRPGSVPSPVRGARGSHRRRAANGTRPGKVALSACKKGAGRPSTAPASPVRRRPSAPVRPGSRAEAAPAHPSKCDGRGRRARGRARRSTRSFRHKQGGLGSTTPESGSARHRAEHRAISGADWPDMLSHGASDQGFPVVVRPRSQSGLGGRVAAPPAPKANIDFYEAQRARDLSRLRSSKILTHRVPRLKKKVVWHIISTETEDGPETVC